MNETPRTARGVFVYGRRGLRQTELETGKGFDVSDRKYFGTDGIRGRVGEWPITAEFMLKLGRAAGTVLAGKARKATVVIGKDTRVSGYMFESAENKTAGDMPGRQMNPECRQKFSRPDTPARGARGALAPRSTRSRSGALRDA